MSVLVSIGFAGIVYFVLCLQLANGFPPFYRSFGSPPAVAAKRRRKAIWIVISGAIPCLGLLGAGPVAGAFVVLGLTMAGLGWQLRGAVSETSSPLWWSYHPLLLRYPMALFDLWTIGWSAGAAGLVLS